MQKLYVFLFALVISIFVRWLFLDRILQSSALTPLLTFVLGLYSVLVAFEWIDKQSPQSRYLKILPFLNHFKGGANLTRIERLTIGFTGFVIGFIYLKVFDYFF